MWSQRPDESALRETPGSRFSDSFPAAVLRELCAHLPRRRAARWLGPLRSPLWNTSITAVCVCVRACVCACVCVCVFVCCSHEFHSDHETKVNDSLPLV